MRLIDALEISRRPGRAGAPPARIFLACGFTPLHLETFLAAYLRTFAPGSAFEIETGLFGDLAGSLERFTPDAAEAAAVVVEWPDLDPRLGIRSLGGWGVAEVSDILASAERMSARIGEALRVLSAKIPVSICLPTLPLPPLFTQRPAQGGAQELRLRGMAASLFSKMAGERGVRVVSQQSLDEMSPPAGRFDVGAEIVAGFPYSLGHADAVARHLASLICGPVPKKGVITDLDGTLWSGILGEVGVDGIAWDMDRQAHLHGLYQQMLASLASAGILVGVASKNDPVLVDQAFARGDIRLSRECVYPFEIHWGRKSESVRRILETWNVGADAVVFIDDSPMELAEVGEAVPGIECLLYPGEDPGALWDLLKHLREVFGKTGVTEEDSVRLRSIREASVLREHRDGPQGNLDDFLRGAGAEIVFSMGAGPDDARAFELINKTNQFNLNGRRLSEAAWAGYLRGPGAFLLTATYSDKYGSLGKIAALLGRREGRRLEVSFWVMSCRAFSRRIEHQCLKYLFERSAADEIVLDFETTPRNGPFRDFLRIWAPEVSEGRISLGREAALGRMPVLYHKVGESTDDRRK